MHPNSTTLVLTIDECVPSTSLGRSEGVTKKAARKAWTKPELKRIGVIKDVSGPDNVGTQGGKS
jgi:hypothetical protein